jgi:thiol-disulfide isomerase/thioredoxin
MRRIELMELVAREGDAVERDHAGHPHEGMPIGAVVPEFELPGLNGETVSLASLRAEKSLTLFLFISPTCNPCKALLPEFDAWQKELVGKINFVFISNGNAADNLDKFGGDADKTILLQKDREVTDLLRAKWTPTALLMDGEGRIASHAAAGDSAIRELVGKLLANDSAEEFSYFTNSNGNSNLIKIGESVPEVSVADLSGKTIRTDYFKGKPTLVAFWSTTCPFCVNMLEDLRTWDKTKGQDEPNLIVFSDGDENDLRDMGLKSPVVYDKGHKTATGFGMFGTPSAVLINEDGKFVTETAIGAPDIWSLIGKRK